MSQLVKLPYYMVKVGSVLHSGKGKHQAGFFRQGKNVILGELLQGLTALQIFLGLVEKVQPRLNGADLLLRQLPSLF